jgi:hypothetical protein
MFVTAGVWRTRQPTLGASVSGHAPECEEPLAIAGVQKPAQRKRLMHAASASAFTISSMPEASGRARSGVFPPPPHRSRWALLAHRAPALGEELTFGPRAQEAWRPKVPISNRLVSGPRSRQVVTILYRLSAIPRWYVEGTMLSTEVRRLASQ